MNVPVSRWQEGLTGRICAVDIDGVMNQYPNPWVEYINERVSQTFHSLWDAKEALPYNVYRRLKAKYRSEGEYQGDIDPKYLEFHQRLIANGYIVIIITSRPFEKFPELSIKTRDWLERNKVGYHYLISSRDKHTEVITRFPNIHFMIEDNRYISNLVAKWGYKVFLVNNFYNQGEVLDKVVRISSFEDIQL